MDKQLSLATDQHHMRTAVAQVIVDVPTLDTNKPFDYVIPASLQDKLKLGSRVIIPFGYRLVQGYVIKLTGESDRLEKLKPVAAVLDEQPPLTEELIKLAHWMSEKYISFLSTTIQAILPSSFKAKSIRKYPHTVGGKTEWVYQVEDGITIRREAVVVPCYTADELQEHISWLPKQAYKQKEVLSYIINHGKVPLSLLLQACETGRSTVKALEKKGLLHIVYEEIDRDPYQGRRFPPSSTYQLTDEQSRALKVINQAIDDEIHRPFLLHGVTGSGKTEIYLQAISRVVAKGKEAIVLVPEIALTAQMVERFKSRFGEEVAVIHSRLSSGERYDAWRRIRKGKAKVAVGARSALFAPFENLGLIIVDEEHESSYKQEENPRYHARDVALFRGAYHRAPVILGSATPSLESYSRARKNVYTLLTLRERVAGRPLPAVRLVDMRQELITGNRSILSRTLYEKIEERLARQEQIVLFLNRRGFATLLICRQCGFVLDCPHCEISLTYHKVDHTSRCHYCGYTERVVNRCPSCQGEELRFYGTGTQKVEEALGKLFPGMRVLRMDVDTTRRKGAHEQLLSAFREHQADCLLGTQMIAKGLDFENVTLVGVIAADGLLHLPDFRSAERTFQLLTQVSGRAGRHQKPGEVVIQSFTPDHYSIEAARHHNYIQFFNREMRFRHRQGYPPYYYLCLLHFAHENMAYCAQQAEKAVQWLRKHLSSQCVILGPVTAPISRIKDRYRYQCMIKYKNEPKLESLLMKLMHTWQDEISKNKLQFSIDMDPQMTL